jgi:hypothetical protein
MKIFKFVNAKFRTHKTRDEIWILSCMCVHLNIYIKDTASEDESFWIK